MKPMRIEGNSRFMSVKEIAAMLGCSVATVRRMLRRSNIAYLRVGRLRRYHFAQIVEQSFRVNSENGERTLSGQLVERFN